MALRAPAMPLGFAAVVIRKIEIRERKNKDKKDFSGGSKGKKMKRRK
jgi:hypothetical protein